MRPNSLYSGFFIYHIIELAGNLRRCRGVPWNARVIRFALRFAPA
jgi:hypothetical protein